MKSIILIRHGQSTFNAAYEATGADPGHIDARLTELGHRQAAKARAELDKTPVDVVLTSPLTRALQTSQLVFGHRDVTVHVTCKHRERLESSCDIGRSPKALKKDFPHLAFEHLADPWWHHQPDQTGMPVIEPFELFEDRVRQFRSFLREHEAERIAVVGHGTFFHALTGYWMQNCEIAHWQVG